MAGVVGGVMFLIFLPIHLLEFDKEKQEILLKDLWYNDQKLQRDIEWEHGRIEKEKIDLLLTIFMPLKLCKLFGVHCFNMAKAIRWHMNTTAA